MKIELSHCYYRYHHFITGHEYAIQDINLVIDSPQVFGLIGPNGAGKSTLLYLLCGLLKPLKGTFFIDEINLYQSKAALANFQKSLALVAQFPEDQFFTDSIYQELSFGLQKQGLSEGAIRRRVVSCLRELELEDEGILRRSPYELGSGEKRLICLAMALLKQPKVLILDEPTVGLDIASSCRLWKTLSRLSQISEITIILASHQLEKVAFLADHLALMHKGRMIAHGSPREIFSRPRLLSDYGLQVPQVTALCYELKKDGVQFKDWPVFEVTEAEAAIKKWLNL